MGAWELGIYGKNILGVSESHAHSSFLLGVSHTQKTLAKVRLITLDRQNPENPENPELKREVIKTRVKTISSCSSSDIL